MKANEEIDVESVMRDLDRIDNGVTTGMDAVSDDTLRTMCEVRAALLKKTVDRPDVDQEWAKVANRLGFDRRAAKGALSKPGPRRGLWIATGVAIGVVASLAVMLLLKAFLPSFQSAEGDSVILYSAVDQRPMVEMDVVADAMADVASQAAENEAEEMAPLTVKESATQPIDDEIEVIDIRKVQAASEMEERIIRTPIGKEIRIILADNTQVLLGSESSLRFPVRFPSDTRRVWLEGEAYFDVAKEEARKFNVVSQNYVTTALGTEFDVKSYTRADVKVSLIEGSVRVEDTASNGCVVLRPGQDVTCAGGKLIVSEIDTKAYRYWKDGYFYFTRTPLVDMLVELGRWYNVNIELESRALMSYKMHFVAKRDEDVSEIADRLNRIGNFKADFDGETLKISEK